MTHALNRPWAITQEGLEVVFSIATREEFFPAALAARRAEMIGQSKAPKPAYQVSDGVAVIPVCGTLLRHGDILAEVSGATSYEAISRSLSAALADEAVKSILLHVNSPGGEAAGCADLATEIRRADAQKPVYAHVTGDGCSAAYWLSAAARRVTCTTTSFLGSIGVRGGLIDRSGADAAAGVKRIEMISSQSPNKRATPVDDTIIARLQVQIDDLGEIFLCDVARYRGVTRDQAAERFGAGDHMIGAKAVACGLADEICDFATALSQARAAQKIPGALPAVRTKKMSTKTLAERLTALSAFAELTAEVRGELAELIPIAKAQESALQATRNDLVAAQTRLDAADYEALLTAAQASNEGPIVDGKPSNPHARKITSPAELARVKEHFATAGDLRKYLATKEQAPKLHPPQPPSAPAKASDEARREYLLQQRGFTGGAQ